MQRLRTLTTKRLVISKTALLVKVLMAGAEE